VKHFVALGYTIWQHCSTTPMRYAIHTRSLQDPDFRTRVRQDSAHFEQTGSNPDAGSIQVAGSGFSNLFFSGFDANTIIKRIFEKI